jgi:hypothetical protein
LNPHSYIESFSGSSSFNETEYDKKKIIEDKTLQKTKKVKILIYENLNIFLFEQIENANKS